MKKILLALTSVLSTLFMVQAQDGITETYLGDLQLGNMTLNNWTKVELNADVIFAEIDQVSNMVRDADGRVIEVSGKNTVSSLFLAVPEVTDIVTLESTSSADSVQVKYQETITNEDGTTVNVYQETTVFDSEGNFIRSYSDLIGSGNSKTRVSETAIMYEGGKYAGYETKILDGASLRLDEKAVVTYSGDLISSIVESEYDEIEMKFVEEDTDDYYYTGSKIDSILSSTVGDGVYNIQYLTYNNDDEIISSLSRSRGFDGEFFESGSVVFSLISVGLSEELEEGSLVFPNPCQNTLSVHSSITQVKVFDATGVEISTLDNVVGQVDLSELDRGLYVLELIGSTTEDRVVQRITKL